MNGNNNNIMRNYVLMAAFQREKKRKISNEHIYKSYIIQSYAIILLLDACF